MLPSKRDQKKRPLATSSFWLIGCLLLLLAVWTLQILPWAAVCNSHKSFTSVLKWQPFQETEWACTCSCVRRGIPKKTLRLQVGFWPPSSIRSSIFTIFELVLFCKEKVWLTFSVPLHRLSEMTFYTASTRHENEKRNTQKPEAYSSVPFYKSFSKPWLCVPEKLFFHLVFTSEGPNDVAFETIHSTTLDRKKDFQIMCFWRTDSQEM